MPAFLTLLNRRAPNLSVLTAPFLLERWWREIQISLTFCICLFPSEFRRVKDMLSTSRTDLEESNQAGIVHVSW